MERLLRFGDGPHHAPRSRGLEARVEFLLLLAAPGEGLVLTDQRLDLRGEEPQVGPAVLVRPELGPAHDEHRRPAQTRIATEPAHQLEGGPVEVLAVDDQHLGLEAAGLLQAALADLGDGDLRGVSAELLGQRVGATGIGIHHEDARAGEDRGVRFRKLEETGWLEELQATAALFEELVAKRLRFGDERLQPLDEVLERLGDRPPRAEDDAHRLVLVVRLSDAQDPGAQLALEELDELVEGRLTELARRFSRALGELARELRDALTDRVRARRALHDRDGAVTKRAELVVQRRVLGEDRDRKDAGRGIEREQTEHVAPATHRRVADEEHEIGRGGDDRGGDLGQAAGLHLESMTRDRRPDGVVHRIRPHDHEGRPVGECRGPFLRFPSGHSYLHDCASPGPGARSGLCDDVCGTFQQY